MCITCEEVHDIGEGREGPEGCGEGIGRQVTEEREAEEADDDKDDEDKGKGGSPTGAPLEYYNDSANSDGVGTAATIVLRDGGADYISEPPSAVGASDGDGGDVIVGNGSQGGGVEDDTEVV